MSDTTAPLLCIFAHPDDEAFGPAGIIALEAQHRPVYSICVTDGNDPGRQDPGLSAVRREELRTSATALGITEVFFLDFPDGTLCNNLYFQVTVAIQAKIDEVQPSTLLTYEPRGISGHIDHVAVSHMTSYVFEQNQTISELWLACISEQERAEIKNYFIHFPGGYPSDQIDRTIDVSSVWEQRVAAIRAHQSQINDVNAVLRIRTKLPQSEYLLVRKK